MPRETGTAPDLKRLAAKCQGVDPVLSFDHYGTPKSAIAEAVRRYAGSLSPSGGAATSNALTTPQGQDAGWLFGLESIGADVEVAVTGGMNRPPYQKDAGIAQLFGKAQALSEVEGRAPRSG